MDSLGAWGPIVFVTAYALACVAFVPASLLTLAAGALFGVVKGTILVLLGATLGALGALHRALCGSGLGCPAHRP